MYVGGWGGSGAKRGKGAGEMRARAAAGARAEQPRGDRGEGGGVVKAAPASIRQLVRPGAPPIDAAEQEQPDHVDEVPVPGRRLEAEMLLRSEVAGARPEEADDEEGGADDDMEAVEAGRHEEGLGIDPVDEVEA